MDVIYRLTFEAAGTDLVGSKDFAELAAAQSFVRESPHKPLKLVRIETTTTDVTDALVCGVGHPRPMARLA